MPTPQLDTLLMRLHRRFQERLRTDHEALEGVSKDASGLPGCLPGAVVLPQSSEEVVVLAKEAASLGVALVPRGGGSGKAGGCIPQGGDVVVDFSRMNRVQSMHPGDLYAVVQPGVVTIELDRAAGQAGLMFPPDPSGWESSTIGGNISTNAGGPRAVKYGVTERYIWGLDLVLPGGDVVRMGRRSIKGVAGYNLTPFVVGSEGTLGLITEATVHLIPAPQAVETAWLTFADAFVASAAAELVFRAGYLPSMLELIDRRALQAVRPLCNAPIHETAGACLLLESDGTAEQAYGNLLAMCEIFCEHGATDAVVASNERQRDGMRRARRIVSTALSGEFPHKFSDDIAVPRSKMPELLQCAQEHAAADGLLACAYGHLGDGNLHLNLLCKSLEERATALGTRGKILAAAVAMGGTVTGEHGIGLAKRDYLHLEQGAPLMALQRRLKQAFDPQNIMNPGKVL